MADRVLVSGGCGFVGATTVRALLGAGYAVRVLDNRAGSDNDYLRGLNVDLRNGDLLDPTAVRLAVGDCSSVVHLAGLTSVLESVQDPLPTFEVNARGTLTLLQACVRAGVSRFVFASSNAVLGSQPPPVDEKTLPRPISPYGASKLAAEAYCAAFENCYGLGTINLRFSNAYGPFSLHKTDVISVFLRRLLAGEALTIYGDGQQTRDFVYVADIACDIQLALEHTFTGVVQIASGAETSINRLIDLLQEVTGRTATLQRVGQPAGEIRRNFSSTDRARSVLGFSPSVGLREGLTETYEWLLEQVAAPQRLSGTA
jgi:UDP-glucose 4-epimerase